MTHGFPDFEALARELAAEGPSLQDLQAVLYQARAELKTIENLGRTADARNAYVVIDQVVSELKQAFPETLCQAGCGRCCRMHRALIRVYRSEWEPVYDHLIGTWPPERLEALVIRFYATYDPYLPLLRELQSELDGESRPHVSAETLPVSCPLLVDGSCSIYPVRPSICRGYGHFELTNATGDRTDIFACNEQRAVLEAQCATDGQMKVRLPSFNPFYQAVADVCEDEEKLLIPLWFARSFARPRHASEAASAIQLPF